MFKFTSILMVFLTCFWVESVKCKNNSTSISSIEENSINDSEISLEDYAKSLTKMLISGRKKGGGGGGMSMFFMKTVMDMFNATVPQLVMGVMGWMKDIMLMGAGAFMMMMYDMVKKGGEEKKIIIKIAEKPPAPPPIEPPASGGYGPWEGR